MKRGEAPSRPLRQWLSGAPPLRDGASRAKTKVEWQRWRRGAIGVHRHADCCWPPRWLVLFGLTDHWGPPSRRLEVSASKSMITGRTEPDRAEQTKFWPPNKHTQWKCTNERKLTNERITTATSFAKPAGAPFDIVYASVNVVVVVVAAVVVWCQFGT